MSSDICPTGPWSTEVSISGEDFLLYPSSQSMSELILIFSGCWSRGRQRCCDLCRTSWELRWCKRWIGCLFWKVVICKTDASDWQVNIFRTRYYHYNQHNGRVAHFISILLYIFYSRSHQLRVHMSHIGHPIVGDTLYAPPDVQQMSSRLCLHAHILKFKHPLTNEVTTVCSTRCDFLPEDLNDLVHGL